MRAQPAPAATPLTITPIGVLHTPFQERASAPRQPPAARGARGTIEIFPAAGMEHALEDLESWSHIWVLFWFHLNQGWRPKVLPPRSRSRKGVLSTRSPHRPNPIGLSVVELERVDGLILHVKDVDMLDGSPVLDLKPYVSYTDALPGARDGWLKPLAEPDAIERPADPEPGFEVVFAGEALAQALFLQETFALDLITPITDALSIGPAPRAYRRIRAEGDALRLAFKEWRARFRVEGRSVTVLALGTGYRPRELVDSDPALEPHRAFVARFGFTVASGTVHPER
jgi:tRNA (adenine37-N6)-methyltransferase